MPNPFAWIADLLKPPVADSIIPVGWTVRAVTGGLVWVAPRQNRSFCCWRSDDFRYRHRPSHN